MTELIVRIDGAENDSNIYKERYLQIEEREEVLVDARDHYQAEFMRPRT